MKRNKTIDMFKETLGELNVPMRDLKHNVKLLKPLKDGIVNQIYDPRKADQITYKLEDIFLISMIAMFAGAKTFEDFADFGEGNSAFFARYFKIKRFAKHDTYNRVFALISPQSFEQILVDFAINVVAKLRKALKIEVQQPIVNIDGKSENGTGENQGTKDEIKNIQHLNVYNSDTGICLSTTSIDCKTNEIPVAIQCLEKMYLKGVTVTADAIHTHTRFTEIVVSKGGDFLLGLKANNPTLLKETEAVFIRVITKGLKCLKEERSIEKSHGQIEERITQAIPISQFAVLQDFVGIRYIVKVTKIITPLHPDKQTNLCEPRTEIRYYITSLNKIEKIVTVIRQHWSVENQLHFLLDTIFEHDSLRIQNKNAMTNVSVLAKFVLFFLKLAQPILKKPSIRRTSNMFRWGLEYSFNAVLSVLDISSLKKAKNEYLHAKKS